MHQITRAAFAVLFLAAPLAAQKQDASSKDDNFSWTGKLKSGAWLRVKNLNGSISVEKASGDVAEVTGEKQWRRGDPEEVRFEIVKDGDNVTICALWGDNSTCNADGAHYRHHGWNNDRDNDVSVKFVIKLPAGVKVDVGTVNGGVDVSGAQSEVQASTVNGRVDASTSGGPVNASTVNGSIRVHMDEMPGTEDLKFSTVNGSITVEVPASFAAEIDMETVNGSLSSDFPITVSGKVNPRHLHAVVGKGGRNVDLKTVNGSIEIKKGS
jgi:DUF4097 and DUF4098 domain-containing protein YvlB